MRPYIVEFTGTPEAGKTTSILKTISILESHGLNVGFVRESAEIVPQCIPKGSWHANIWMRCITLAKTIEMSYCNQYDVVICDRGPLDGIFLGYLYQSEGKCDSEVCAYINFIRESKIKPDILITLFTTPEEAIRRRGGEGRLVTKKWVQNYNTLLYPFFASVDVEKIWIDTTNQSAQQVKDKLVEIIEKNVNDFRNNQ